MNREKGSGKHIFPSLDGAEQALRRTGLLLIVAALVSLLGGIWRGTRRRAGLQTGPLPGLLRSRLFYLVATVGYVAVCYRLWRPLPLALSRTRRAAALVVGSLLFFPGVALVLWGRLALGEMYFVSSGLGAQLYGDHRLITTGPFALVRHPMYLGIVLLGLGGLLLYRTWTFLWLLAALPALWLRARREEAVLAQAFGVAWADYCRRVPAWLPLPDSRSRSGRR